METEKIQITGPQGQSLDDWYDIMFTHYSGKEPPIEEIPSRLRAFFRGLKFTAVKKPKISETVKIPGTEFKSS